MRVGVVKLCAKESAEKELKEGSAFIGVDAESLLDEVNVLEINHGYNLAQVLAELKYNLLVATGRVTPVDKPDDGKGKKK